MSYKIFGIYTIEEEDVVCVIVDMIDDELVGISIPFNGNKGISNEIINNYLNDYWFEIKKENLFKVSLVQYPDIFEECGYLGQVKEYYNNNLLKKLKTRTKKLIIDN